MDDVADRASSRWLGALLVVLAAAATITYLVLPPGSRDLAIASKAMATAACLTSALVIWISTLRGRTWVGASPMAALMFFLGVAFAGFLATDISTEGAYGPRASDVGLLLIMLPLLFLARNELRAHFPKQHRGEIAMDALLVGASAAVLLYLVIHAPIPDRTQLAVSSGVFAVLAVAPATLYGVLLLWVPSRIHVAMFVILAAIGAATAGLGYEWARGLYDGTATWIDLTFIIGPLAIAVAAVTTRGHGGVEASEPLRWARSVLTSVSVVMACTALALLAIFDDSRALGDVESTLMIGVLGIGVAARILANQVASTQAHSEVATALAEKDTALREAADALDRVREANETLRNSEEHLGLIFESAEDGAVELDGHGVITRVNEAFTEMVHLDRVVLEGQPWSAVAASIAGADADFAALASGGSAEVRRAEGQSVFLESRVSRIPTDPPRTLIVIRDVSAAQVADQTIRSLFKFLQDRDEDRTNLLRRTNAAIESERNRIARDLHDGPVQGVSAASLSLEAALLMIRGGDTGKGLEVLGKIREELAEEAGALRTLMSGLRPPVLEERGLAPALRESIERFGTEFGVHTEFVSHLGSALPEDLETLAYRVVQEALGNVARHADAASVIIAVESDDDSLRVEIRDDGVGFDSALARQFLRDGRVGLASMRERVELASGTFLIRSSPGRGTQIQASLPVAAAPGSQELTVEPVS